MAYAPPPYLMPYGRPLGPDEMPPVLLRFPGACGVRDALQGTLASIARTGDPLAYFTSKNFDYIREGVSHFGCWIVFTPEHFHPVKADEPSVYIGVNLPVLFDRDLTWAPPRLMESVPEWDRYDSVQKVHDLIGPSMAEERREMLDVLNAYFEEISALVRSDLPLPDRPWFQLPPEKRREILKQLGHKGRWSGAP